MKPALQRWIAALLGLWLVVGGLWPASGACLPDNVAGGGPGLHASGGGGCCKPSALAACCNRDCCVTASGEAPAGAPAVPVDPPGQDRSCVVPTLRFLFVLPHAGDSASCARLPEPTPVGALTIPLFLRDRVFLI